MEVTLAQVSGWVVRYLLTIQITDILDIAIMAFVLYKIFTLVQSTKAASLVKGLLIFLAALVLSSALHLQNTWSIADPRQQAIPVALAVGRELLAGAGAIRVHGGGFAGTIQAFVPLDKLEPFKAGLERVLGAGTCHVPHIPAVGAPTLRP